MQPEWALDLWRQCKATGVPFWFKGWGATGDPFLLPGGDRYSKDDYADMLRMEPTRELPAVVS
jgi:protein gp37